MKHYLTNNEIRAIEEGQEFLVKSDWVLLSEEELHAKLNPPKTEEQIIAEKVIEARVYLTNTDYIVTKIAEAQALGEDTTLLLSKYAVELQQRKEAREFIGANS